MKHRPYKSATERNREVARQQAEAANMGDTVLSFSEIDGIPRRRMHSQFVIDEINHFDPEKMMAEVREQLGAHLDRKSAAEQQAILYANGMSSKGMFGIRSHQHHVINYLLRDPNAHACITGRRRMEAERQVYPWPMPSPNRHSHVGSLLEKLRPLSYLNNHIHVGFGGHFEGVVNVGTIGHVDNFTLRNATPNPVTRIVRHLYADNTPVMASNPTILDAVKSSPWQWYEPKFGSYTMKYPQIQQIRK